ncbi:MAG: hypothetical protein ABJG41_19360 [Cyclobacteriaceae bacterium]
MKIIFPRPFAIAIDDLGWMNGRNEGEDGYGPYRLGINRKTTLADYQAVVDLAQQTGVRLQGLFILGEMDRENFLGDHPTTTYMRENWDNSENISDLQIKMIDYVKEQASHLEFAFHGVGHEFWPQEGIRRRAEWYNTDDDQPWPEEQIREHVECFVRIMRQYGISKELGHSFPESFVPCAYSYYWNPDGAYSLGKVLSDYGVKFANTDFTQIPECNPPIKEGGGFDHKVHVMDRYNYGNLWFEEGKLPTTAVPDQPTDYIETHWPNLLAGPGQSQKTVTEKWTTYYQTIQGSNDRYCAKNTAQMHSQWLYNRHTKVVEIASGVIEIDNTSMPAEAYEGFSLSNLVLKVKLDKSEHVQSAVIDGKTIPAYFEDQGFGFLYLPQLMREKYTLRYEIGTKMPNDLIWHDGTSNIFDVETQPHEVKIDLCLYGKQTLKLRTSKVPFRVESNNSGIAITDWKNEGSMLLLELKAHDLQGELGSIKIHY